MGRGEAGGGKRLQERQKKGKRRGGVRRNMVIEMERHRDSREMKRWRLPDPPEETKRDTLETKTHPRDR